MPRKPTTNNQQPPTPSTHGGARQGAGRPRLPPAEATRRYSFTLTPSQYRLCLALGHGNASLGLRIALDHILQHPPDKA